MVSDRRETHVGDAPRPSPHDRGDALAEVVYERDHRVDDDDELGAVLDSHVDVGGRADAAVDELPAVDAHRLVDHRQRTGGGDRGGDGYVHPLAVAHHDALRRVEIGRGDVELRVEQTEVVGAIRVGQRLLDVALDPPTAVDAGRQPAGEPVHHIHGGDLTEMRQA